MTTVATSTEVVQLDIHSIVPSKTNRTLTSGAVEEMTASIAKDGLLQPITVRPKGSKFEIVFGECRWRGAGKAGLTAIPAIVRDMSDEEAQREQIIENLHRSNPGPMDEAKSYEGLRKLIGKSATHAVIAAQVGKPEAYVAQRLKLLELIPEAQKALSKEAIGLGHALLIAPLEGDVQAGVVKWLLAGFEEAVDIDNRGWNEDTIKTIHTVPALRAFIERNFFLALDKAPFDITDAKLNPKMGACTTCPHNTVNATTLFPDHTKKAICTLPSCFYEKRSKALDVKIEEVKKADDLKTVYRLGLGHSSWNEGDGAVKVDGYLARSSYDSGPRLVKLGTECKSTKTAVLVFRGANEDKSIKAEVGDKTLICDNPNCSKHGKKSAGAIGGTPKTALKGMAFVNHKAKTLTESREQRVRWAVYKALVGKLLEAKPSKSSIVGYDTMIEIAADTALVHLYSDSSRDAAKALGWVKAEGKKSAHSNYEPWGDRFSAFFSDNKFALLFGTLAAEDIRQEKPKTSRIYRMAAIFKVNVAKIKSEIAKADKELIGGMEERAKAKEKKPKAKAKALAKEQKKVDKAVKKIKARRHQVIGGKCKFCKCTEEAACPEGCGWANEAKTVCSTAKCVAKAQAKGMKLLLQYEKAS